MEMEVVGDAKAVVEGERGVRGPVPALLGACSATGV
jgi:hypothetical protein